MKFINISCDELIIAIKVLSKKKTEKIEIMYVMVVFLIRPLYEDPTLQDV